MHHSVLAPSLSGSGSHQTVLIVYHTSPSALGPTITIDGHKVSRIFRPVLLLLQWSLWIIYLAGACLVQSSCNRGDPGPEPFGPTSAFQLGAGLGGIGACTQYFGQLWWSVFLQFVTLIGATALWVVMQWDISCFSKTIMYFHIMTTVQMFGIAWAFINSTYQVTNNLIPIHPVSFNWVNGSYLISAGCVGNLVCNFVYIIYLSLEFPPKFPHHQQLFSSPDGLADVTDSSPKVLQAPTAVKAANQL